jgi:hypothetical protein
VRTVVNKQYQIFDMKPKLLDNDFYIDAELVGQDVYDEVETLQRAQLLMQLRLMSREDVLERVMNEQDTQTQIDKMDIEETEAAIPELKLKRVIQTYMDRGMMEEANIAKEQLGLLLIQKQQQLAQTMGQSQGTPQGQPPQGTPPPTSTPTQPPQGAGG